MGGAHMAPAHMGGAHMAPAHHAHYGAAHHPGNNYRGFGYGGTGVFIGLGGFGMGGLGYGLGYGSLGYGGYGYGPGYGYNYGYPGTYPGSYTNRIGVPAISGTYYATPSTNPYLTTPYQVYPLQQSVQPMVPPGTDPEPQPLPLPVPGQNPQPSATAGQTGTLTVITDAGATVTFDGIDTKETGTRHSFTTKPIPVGIEKRILVKVDGPGGPSSITLSLRGGEKATVDMRK